MEKTNLTILKQTNKALIQLGYKSERERATYLASKMEVNYPTAMRWVCLKSWPRKWLRLNHVMTMAGFLFYGRATIQRKQKLLLCW